MAPQRDRSAPWSSAEGCGVTSHLVLSFVLVMMLTDLTAQEAFAWKDEGHMLVAAVARVHMKPETVQKVEGVLALWKSLYPSTSTLEDSAVWMDHIACASPGEYCNFERQDNLQLFNKWHFCNMPWNPQNISLRLIDKVLPLPYSGADWALPTIYNALRKCKPDKRLLPDLSAEMTARAGTELKRGGEKGRMFAASALSYRERAATRQQQQQQQQIHRSKAGAAGKLSEQDGHRNGRLLVTQHPEAVTFSKSSARIPREGREKKYNFSAASAKVADKVDVTEGSQHSGSLPEDGSFGGAVCSVVSYSLYIRLLIHIYGDVHQPLHASEVFSRAFPRGDYGGNRVYVELPRMEKDEALSAAGEEANRETFHHNLHGEWDSVFGQYPHHYQEIDKKRLRQEAIRLIQAHPVDSAAMKMYDDFLGVIEESNKIAKEYAYKEFDWKTFDYHSLPYKPTKEYIQGARKIGEERIALGGARLAALLSSIAEYLPNIKAAPASLSPASAIETVLRAPAAEGGPLKEEHWFVEETSHEQWLSLSTNPAALPRLRKGENHPAGDQFDSVEDSSGYWMLSMDEKRQGDGVTGERQELGGTNSPAFSFSLGLGLSALLVLLLTSIAALLISWRKLRMYKRALQVVFQRGGAAADVSAPAAAAAKSGDWHSAAALLGEGEGEPQKKEDAAGHEEAGSDVGTALDAASGFDVTTTARLLTCKRDA